MNKIIKQVLKYQQNKEEYDFEKIVKALKWKIQYYCKKVPHYYREDVKQELLMNLYQAVTFFKFKEFMIPKEIFNDKSVDKNANHFYFNQFLKKYEKNFFEIVCENQDIRKKLIFEYTLYCNERQFNSYINRGFDFVVNNFLRKNVYKNNEIISLNSVLENNQELIETIIDKKYTDISIFEKYEISYSDKEFLEHFIQKGKILSEMEVAKELGISQQAVSKRRKKIIENYKKQKK